MLESAEPVEGSGEVALNQIVRQALPVTVQVPGPLEPAFEFGRAGHIDTAGRSVVQVGITNTGNAHVEPAGDLTIRDDSGETVSEAEATMSNFFAGTETQVETTLDGALDCCISRCLQSDLFSLSQTRRVTPNDGKGVHGRRPVLG